ncbi:hypothetical protein BDQ17DRAFT_1418816 [Cyathus striatus]|nr:hypothetical protein BDQ17DRAFT_1418816 [Cyathus striatus]
MLRLARLARPRACPTRGPSSRLCSSLGPGRTSPCPPCATRPDAADCPRMSPALLPFYFPSSDPAQQRKQGYSHPPHPGQRETRPSRPLPPSPPPKSSAPAPTPLSHSHPRHASTAASPPAAAHEKGVAPGIPPPPSPMPRPLLSFSSSSTSPTSLSPTLSLRPKSYVAFPFIPFNVNPHVLALHQPYVPDFWSSSTPQNPELEVESPVMVVVGGEGTHLLSPTHNLLFSASDIVVPPLENGSLATSSPPNSATPGQGGVWDDIAEDIGLPPPQQIKQAFWKIFS